MLKIALDPVSQEKLHLLLIGEIRNLQERFRTACYTAHTLHVPVSRPDADTRYVVDLRHILKGPVTLPSTSWSCLCRGEKRHQRCTRCQTVIASKWIAKQARITRAHTREKFTRGGDAEKRFGLTKTLCACNRECYKWYGCSSDADQTRLHVLG